MEITSDFTRVVDMLDLLSNQLENGGVLLICATFWSLKCQSNFFQQTSNRYFTQSNTKPTPNIFSNHSTCPKGKLKLQLPWGLTDNNPIDFLKIITGKLCRTASCLSSVKSFYTTFSLFCKPLLNARPGNTPKCSLALGSVAKLWTV